LEQPRCPQHGTGLRDTIAGFECIRCQLLPAQHRRYRSQRIEASQQPSAPLERVSAPLLTGKKRALVGLGMPAGLFRSKHGGIPDVSETSSALRMTTIRTPPKGTGEHVKGARDWDCTGVHDTWTVECRLGIRNGSGLLGSCLRCHPRLGVHRRRQAWPSIRATGGVAFSGNLVRVDDEIVDVASRPPGPFPEAPARYKPLVAIWQSISADVETQVTKSNYGTSESSPRL